MNCANIRDRPELRSACITLLNSEWPRSEYARGLYLEKSFSSGALPASLLLLDSEGQLLGHARLCDIPGRPEHCWVESVVVQKSARGQGYGRQMMNLTENYSKQLGFTRVYLSTHDQQIFYTKCGYVYCEPICTVGANSKLFNAPQFEQFVKKLNETPARTEIVERGCAISKTEAPNSVPAPPPPPPPSVTTNNRFIKQQFMFKDLL